MRTVQIMARVAADADRIFDRIRAFERYPELTAAVRDVAVTTGPDGLLLSDWEVGFRDGILRWSEEDRIDAEQRTITFRQTTGDFETFEGVWSVEPADDGCVVRMISTFDLGIPTLAEMLEPIAESALRESIGSILTGLIDEPLDIRPAFEAQVTG